MFKNSFVGHYRDFFDFSKSLKQLAKVWQKFSDPLAGKANQQPMREHWLEWARRLPKSAFVVWLAGQVADDMLRHINVKRTNLAALSGAVDSDMTGTVQHSAERFLENYFFGYPSFEPQCRQMIQAFRKIVKRKLTDRFKKG
jgi:hypothetical protein